MNCTQREYTQVTERRRRVGYVIRSTSPVCERVGSMDERNEKYASIIPIDTYATRTIPHELNIYLYNIYMFAACVHARARACDNRANQPDEHAYNRYINIAAIYIEKDRIL